MGQNNEDLRGHTIGSSARNMLGGDDVTQLVKGALAETEKIPMPVSSVKKVHNTDRYQLVIVESNTHTSLFPQIWSFIKYFVYMVFHIRHFRCINL